MRWQQWLEDLESGSLRAASPLPDGSWQVNREVKEAILEAFRVGEAVAHEGYVDKHTVLPRAFNVDDGVRLVPGGSSVRRGAYIAPGVVIMPPAYVNIGAFVDEGTLVDSHVLVGSCAQVGKHVHLSAGVQLGGVLEPIGQLPVIVEDDAFIGADAVIVEGLRVGAGAVIAPSVVLSRSVQTYDAVNQTILEKGAPIPPRAVVVPGTRPLTSSRWARKLDLGLYCPVIVKYREASTDAALILEQVLR